MISETVIRTDRAVSKAPSIQQVLQYAFWTVLLVVFPLAIAPSVDGNGFNAEQWYLLPKALMLGVAFVLGSLAILAAYSDRRLYDAVRLLYLLPNFLKLAILLVPLTLFIGLNNVDSIAVTSIGSPARLDGALIRAIWIALSIVSYLLVRRSALQLSRLVALFTLGATLIGMWAALQTMLIEPLWLLGFELRPTGTPVASFGHRALVTCHVAMGLVVAGAWAVLRGRNLLVWTLVCVLLSCCLIMTQGRAGLIGFIVAWIAVLLYVVIKRANWRMMGLISVVIFVSGLTASILTTAGSSQFTTIVDAAQGSDRSFSIRYEILWPVALKSIWQMPWMGWGIDGFSTSFWENSTQAEQYRAVRSHLSRIDYPIVEVTGTPAQIVRDTTDGPASIVFFTMDRAHNFYLDTAVSFGLPYTLIILAILVSWGLAVLRSRSAFALSFGAAALAYLVFSLSWFAVLQLTPFLWVIVGATAGAIDAGSQRAGAVNV